MAYKDEYEVARLHLSAALEAVSAAAFEWAVAGRVKILEKNDALNKRDVESHLCVMLLMLQSANRETQETCACSATGERSRVFSG